MKWYFGFLSSNNFWFALKETTEKYIKNSFFRYCANESFISFNRNFFSSPLIKCILLIFEMFYHLFQWNTCIGVMFSHIILVWGAYNIQSMDIHVVILFVSFSFLLENWGERAIKLNDTNVNLKLRTIQIFNSFFLVIQCIMNNIIIVWYLKK